MAQRDPRLDVVGWELWPMHSRRDGLSARARQADHVLASFARASRGAALGFEAAPRGEGRSATPVRGVVLASTLGYDLLAGMEIPGLTLVGQGTHGGIRVRRYWHEEAKRSLFAIRRQLFSGWGTPTTEQRQALLDWVWAAGPDNAPRAINPAAEPAPFVEDNAAEGIYELVEEVLGVACGCETGSRHDCPPACHTWRRQGDIRNARVMVRRPGRGGTVHLCIPCELGPACEQALDAVTGVGARERDVRNANIWRIGFKPDLEIAAHIEFLRHWLPQTIT